MACTLADAYRRFGVDAAGTSPLYERVAVALGGSPAALRAIEAAPARRRQPALILAALHDLALNGRAPALAAAYTSGDGDAAAAAAIDTLVRDAGAVAALAARRTVKDGETGRCAVLYPAIAEAARRLGAGAVGLIDLGCSAGLNLSVDRVAVTYDGHDVLGDPASPVRMSAKPVGRGAVATTAIPAVVARIGVDRDPLDVTDVDDARWRAPACRRTGRRRQPGWPRSWRWPPPTRPSCCGATRSTCCPRPSPGCRPMPCPSSSPRGRWRGTRSASAPASPTGSAKRPRSGRWRGCRSKGSASRRAYRLWGTGRPRATASSA
nr:DUF2332 domain-containing protein [Hamadaea tsunoensis]